MISNTFAARLAPAALLVALFFGPSPQQAAAQASSAQKPFIAIEQDGNMTSSTKDEIAFKRAPFSIVVALPKHTDLQARVSTDRRVFDLARSGGSLEESFGKYDAMAEGLRNGNEQVFLTGADENAHHTWYYESPSDHRFDYVELRPQGVLARRTVSHYSERGGSMKPIDMLPAKELFFVFRLVAGSKELGRAAIKVTFDGEPISLGSPVVALVGGRPIALDAFKAAYQAAATMKRSQYGALTINELRALGVPLQVLQQLVDSQVAVIEAERHGIRVTDAEVAAAIKAMPAFQEGGKFVGAKRYSEILQAQRPVITREDFVERVRQSLAESALMDRVQPRKGTGLEQANAFQAYLAKARANVSVVLSRELFDRVVAEVN
jgi:hypothetical protein